MNRVPPISVGQILTGALFNEPMRVEIVQDNGPGSLVVGLVGTRSERFRSALYPKGSEEKGLLDAMLLAVPR